MFVFLFVCLFMCLSVYLLLLIGKGARIGATRNLMRKGRIFFYLEGESDKKFKYKGSNKIIWKEEQKPGALCRLTKVNLGLYMRAPFPWKAARVCRRSTGWGNVVCLNFEGDYNDSFIYMSVREVYLQWNDHGLHISKLYLC